MSFIPQIRGRPAFVTLPFFLLNQFIAASDLTKKHQFTQICLEFHSTLCHSFLPTNSYFKALNLLLHCFFLPAYVYVHVFSILKLSFNYHLLSCSLW